MENRAIGIFDSGIGGLTVLKEIRNVLPNENIIYYGDNINNPYGNKTAQEIFDLSFKMINFLLAQDVKLIVIACNTISAVCFDKLNQIFKDRVKLIEIIKSGVKAGFLSVRKNKYKSLRLLATEATVSSNAYQNFFYKRDSKINLIAKSCPDLVKLAEKNLFDTEISKNILKRYLSDFKLKNINILILGCTHFPVFENQIKKILPGVEIINPAKFVALKVKKYLEQNNILNKNIRPKMIFYTSGDKKNFNIVANQILDYNFPCDCFINKVLD